MGNRQAPPPPGPGQQQAPQEEVHLSYWQMMRLGYAELVNAIIRPPRAEYDLAHLGPKTFEFCDKRYRRIDFEIPNEKQQRLQCSQWEPVEYPPDGRLPCLIYMHGNSSARVEALPQLSLCLALGISLVAIDFAGSGLSDGEFVSLGYYEKDDLKVLIQHLRGTGRVSSIALWGRSMGAATALMHGERDPSIAAMILDSSFADLQQLADEMVDKGREHGVNVPRFVTRLTLRLIKSSVQARAGFSISHLSPISHAPRCYIPALFIAGRHDDFISARHSQQIHDVYGGDKNIILVEGDHNSIRPKFLFDSVGNFLQMTLQLKDAWTLPSAHKYMGMPPWVKLGDDDQFAYDDDDAIADYWSDYVFDDAVATSPGRLVRNDGVLAGSEGRLEKTGELAHQMGIGMTQARQREVQSALYHALGQRGPNGSGSLRLDDAADAKQQQQQHLSSSLRPPSTSSMMMVSPSSVDGINGSGSSSTGSGRRRVLPEAWACPACTLINSRMQLSCEACETIAPLIAEEERLGASASASDVRPHSLSLSSSSSRPSSVAPSPGSTTTSGQVPPSASSSSTSSSSSRPLHDYYYENNSSQHPHPQPPPQQQTALAPSASAASRRSGINGGILPGHGRRSSSEEVLSPEPTGRTPR